MHYGHFDRMPVFHWSGWNETLERWYKEGLPEDMDQHEFFGTTPTCCKIDVDVYLYPAFDEQVFEETETYKIIRQGDGVIAKHWKNRSCIPHFMDFSLKDADGWEEYRKRLQPHPGRLPRNWTTRSIGRRTRRPRSPCGPDR